MLGATGPIGRAVVAAARRRGHEVVVLVRDPTRLDAPAEGSGRDATSADAVVVGDALDRHAVRRATVGVDAVVSCLGVGGKGDGRPTTLVSRATDVLVRVLAQASQPPRLVVMSNIGAGDSGDPITRHVVVPRIAPWLASIVADKDRREALLANSSLDWAAVRMPHAGGGAAHSVRRTAKGRAPGHHLDAVRCRCARGRGGAPLGLDPADPVDQPLIRQLPEWRSEATTGSPASRTAVDTGWTDGRQCEAVRASAPPESDRIRASGLPDSSSEATTGSPDHPRPSTPDGPTAGNAKPCARALPLKGTGSERPGCQTRAAKRRPAARITHGRRQPDGPTAGNAKPCARALPLKGTGSEHPGCQTRAAKRRPAARITRGRRGRMRACDGGGPRGCAWRGAWPRGPGPRGGRPRRSGGGRAGRRACRSTPWRPAAR